MEDNMEDKSESETVHAFYQTFQSEHTALADLIGSLVSLGEAERGGVVDQCLSRINQLSDNVKDAASYLPAYDQRKYSEQLKALSDKLSSNRKALAPKQKFSFKAKAKVTPPKSTPRPMPLASSAAATRAKERATPQNQVSISSKSFTYIDFSSLGTASNSVLLSDLTGCFVNLVSPTTNNTTSTPFPSTAALKTITSTLLLLRVDGPIHLTSIHNSILLLSCRQFRMHDSTNSIVYLFSPSRPIIEDSTGIKFAPFPTELVAKLPSHTVNTRNLWDQVDDFKWLRKEHSPNWEVLGKEGRLGGEVLEKIEERAGRSGDVRGVLEMVGIKGKEGEGGDEEEI